MWLPSGRSGRGRPRPRVASIFVSEQTTTGWQLLRSFAVLLVFLGLVGAAIYGAAVALDHLRTGVAAGVLTASATVLISVVTLVASQRADRRKAIEQSVRERKVPLYDELLGF
jgi:multidrug transporter EmrE-like cation transporter